MGKVQAEMITIKLIALLFFSKSSNENRIRRPTRHTDSDIHFIDFKSGQRTSPLISPFIQSEKIGKFTMFGILTRFQIRFNVEMRCNVGNIIETVMLHTFYVAEKILAFSVPMQILYKQNVTAHFVCY